MKYISDGFANNKAEVKNIQINIKMYENKSHQQSQAAAATTINY